mmetsp:Transcript_23591/g.53219  ORF Transcript_23591/g.53219 Transcript_23591/m.53219 type:complete len:427 (-) Transcript_23591:4-1284(-)|eukprot:CAMPEP_0172581552 /NCGR_PEP_ID=MMETSP1068-20121228/775_1 /TAXON_ID=35684 /ORGANISM="Pseudopedinella elastica, Strain CCMP716" /LENGTH=426 /DNA_ID=CAMNT_0013374571 /DNA_START=21 /DNA_END=1301 /DNA_ORIENTATION=+
MMFRRVIGALCCAGVVAADSFSKVVVFGPDGAPAVEALSTSAHGPALPESGLLGRLVYLGSDVTACSGILSTVNAAVETAKAASSGLKPIVLIERSAPGSGGACSFEDKVMAVQQAGASAAVVFDYVSEGPVAMYYEHPEDVRIPAVFVSNEVGAYLLEALLRVDLAAPAVLLRPGGGNDQDTTWSSLFRFEYLSFSVGYLLLAACVLPVAACNARALLARRRALEAVNSAVHASGERVKAQVLEALRMLPGQAANAAEQVVLPSPRSRAQGPGATPPPPPCRKLYKFLCLALVCFVFQMTLTSFALDQDASEAAEALGSQGQEGSDDLAVLFGINSLLNAFVNAALLTALAAALKACKACLCASRAGDAEEAQAQDEEAGDEAALAKEARQAGKSSTVQEGALYVELKGTPPVVSVKCTPVEACL